MNHHPPVPTSAPEPRLAIIGGGMGGISTAYFCDSVWKTDLFEARSSLGGHAATELVHEAGQAVAVDVGAESFNPATHPLYWALLQELDAIESTRWGEDPLVEMPATLSIFDAKTRRPLFVSTRPLHRLKYSVNFFAFSRAGLAFMANDPSHEVTVGEWFDGLVLDRSFKQDVLQPWLASLTCCSIELFRQQSALAFLLQFVRTFPENIFRAPKTYCSNIGLKGFLQMLVDRCQRLTVHTDAPVSNVEEVQGAWFVETPAGRHGPYARVVVNAPPHASRTFLGTQPDELLRILDKHRYYPARLVIHTDPVTMPDREFWCSHNAAVDGGVCEATVWLGSARKNARTGKPLQLFKSWASHRAVQPRSILTERTFLHPLCSPESMRAAKELERWQGRRGLFFTGHYLTLTDLQESALFSGIAVARALNPASDRLRSLQQRVARAGREQVSYAVGQFRQ